MAVMKIVIIAAIRWACHLVAPQEKVCSTFGCTLGMMQSSPGNSCGETHQSNKASRGVSGSYWINTTTGVHQVHCSMELECGGYKGGWMRIADFDTSREDDCPSGWNKITTPNQPSHLAIPVCRSPSDTLVGYFSTTFTVNKASYNAVCGKIKRLPERYTFRFW